MRHRLCRNPEVQLEPVNVIPTAYLQPYRSKGSLLMSIYSYGPLDDPETVI